jgi:hypothetical protein
MPVIEEVNKNYNVIVCLLLYHIVMCMPLIRWVLIQMIGFISGWVTGSLVIMITYKSYSAITVLHTLQFTVLHAL